MKIQTHFKPLFRRPKEGEDNEDALITYKEIATEFTMVKTRSVGMTIPSSLGGPEIVAARYKKYIRLNLWFFNIQFTWKTKLKNLPDKNETLQTSKGSPRP